MKKHALLFAAILLAMPQAQASDFQFAAEANTLCRTIIDARDYDTFRTAQDQSLDLTMANIRSITPPSLAEAETLSQSLQAVNDDLTAAIARLQTLPPSAELDAFLAYGQSRIDINSARIGFLADLENWQWPLADSLHTNRYDFNKGMEDLGFNNRDCTFVFGSLGNPPEIEDVITVAAPVCNAQYNHLVQTDIDQWRVHNTDALAAILQNKSWDPDAIPSLRQLAETWRDTTDAFRQAGSTLENTPPQWEEVLANLDRHATIFQNRADALESGDADTIAQAFDERLGLVDFRQLGLNETSCMALATLM